MQFSQQKVISRCTSSHSGNNSVKVTFSKTDYFPNTMGPFAVEEMVEEDCCSGEQAENSHFHPIFGLLTTFLKKDPKLP